MAYLFKDSIKERIEESTIYVSDRVFDELDEVYRKARAFDKLVKFYPQKDELPSDEFFMIMGYMLKEADDER